MLEKGTTLAGYRIDAVLGQGGMGTVYEATQLSLDRVVALKLLAQHLGDDVAFRERFRREGQIQARLEHAHIVTVYEAGETEHGLFIAMRLVRGRTLKDMILARELDAGRALRILEPLADALDEAHRTGLIHRDIKPQNVLVGGRDHAYLADFGLTKATTERSLTKSGYFLGTLDYVSPEQIQGERATAASDVYSLAGVLYECLTGVVPYPKESEAAVLYAHVADPPPKLSDQRPELPQELDAVMARAMAKDPADRYDSASALIEAAGRTFTRRTRAALTTPGPLEMPEETGIRKAEEHVETRPSERPAAPPAPGAPETKPAQESPPVPEETVTSDAPPPALPKVADETVPGDAPRRTPILLWALGGLAVLVVAGFFLGRALAGDEGAADPPAPVSAGAVALSPPGSWTRSDQAPGVPGLDLEDPIALAPEGGPRDAAIVAGTTAATGPALLPDSLLDRLGGDAPAPQAVKLGDLEAYRYEDLRLGDRDLRVYAVPTSAGVATVACQAPDAGAIAADCERAAASLRLRGADAFALGPDADYAEALDAAIGRLNAATGRGALKLRRAARPAAQAAAAARLAGAYGAAGADLRGATANPLATPANAALVAALGDVRRAYRGLAGAARRADAAAYTRGRREIAAAQAALRDSLRRAGRV